jgi:hypothetical protein
MTTTTHVHDRAPLQIAITHYGDSIDPNGSYDEETFTEVVADLERRYRDALLRQYPNADITFIWSDRAGDGVACSHPDELETIREIVGLVFDTGLFWI